MASREFLLIVKEKAFGVPTAVADRVLGTNAWYVRLDTDNAFTMQMVPAIEKTSHGGGFVVPVCAHSDNWVSTGALQGQVYPGSGGLYGKFLADWAFTRINVGRTTPWTTTNPLNNMPPTDLASASIYHAVMEDDGTYQRRLYNGVKVSGGAFEVSDQSPRALRFNFNIQGIRDDLNAAQAALWAAGSPYVPAAPDATEFPAPTEDQYVPCGPYVFSDTVGKFALQTARSMYQSIALNFTHVMNPKWFESKYLLRNVFRGTDLKVNAALLRKKTPDDEASYRALTSHDVSVEFNNSAAFLKFDLGDNNKWDSLVRSLPNGDEYMWNGVMQNYLSSTGEVVIVTGGDVEEEEEE